MGIPQDIKVNIVESGDKLPELFCLFIEEIFACTKSDIVDLEIDDLRLLRKYLFDKLCEQRPSLQEIELCYRRKMKLVAEDVYIIAYSLVNGLEHKGLKNHLKPDKEYSNESLNHLNGEIFDVHLFKLCSDLMSLVSSLNNTVENLQMKVATLENNATQMKATVNNNIKEISKKQVITADVHRDFNGNPQMPKNYTNATRPLSRCYRR